MKFFLPEATDDAQAEQVYAAVARFNNAVSEGPRIYKIDWSHHGNTYSAHVGGTAPAYYRTGNEPVVAILDCGIVYKICTTSRGVMGGEGIFVGKNEASALEHFDA